MEEKIERNELISFLKKISENTLTKEIEVEVPLGLPHSVYTDIQPQTVKINVKWLLKRVINELKEPAKKEENINTAICIKPFCAIRNIGLNLDLKDINKGELFTIVRKDDNSIILEDTNAEECFTLSILCYNEHFKNVKDIYPIIVCKHDYNIPNSGLSIRKEQLAARYLQRAAAVVIIYNGKQYVVPIDDFNENFEQID